MNGMPSLWRKGSGKVLLALCLSAVSAVSGCTTGTSGQPDSPASALPSSQASGSADDAVAVVGGRTITRSQLTDRLWSGYGAETLRDMMLRVAVGLEAEKLGIAVTDRELDDELKRSSEGYGSESEFYAAMASQLGMDREAVREDARYRLLTEKLATYRVDVPEEQILQYYHEHQSEYGPRKQFHLAWVVTDTKKEADAVLGELEGGADFAALAARYSTDESTADEGGDLGWVDERDPLQDPRVLSAAGRLNPGEAAGPLKTDQGYAVVLLKGLKTEPQRNYDAVRDEIRRELALEKAAPIRDLEQSLLAKYGARVLDERLKPR